MTQLLFWGLAYLVVGVLLALLWRVRGLPAVIHDHRSTCYAPRDDYRSGPTNCHPRWGGQPMMALMWLAVVVWWPGCVFGVTMFFVGWLFVRALSVRF